MLSAKRLAGPITVAAGLAIIGLLWRANILNDLWVFLATMIVIIIAMAIGFIGALIWAK